jgi:TRAP transporter 4TM/12TM fusion protein
MRAALKGLNQLAALVLLAAILGWILDAPGWLGLAFYTEQFLAVVVGSAAVLIFTHAGQTVRAPGLRLGLAVAAALALAYVAQAYPQLQLELVSAKPMAVVLGLVIVALVLEATRIKTGVILPALVLLLVAFALWLGPHLPQAYATREVSFSRIVMYLALDTNALFSKILYIAAVVVAPFIVFGGLLNGFGGGHLFSILATRAVGRYRGGEAKVAVVGSTAFGMISGSAVGNVVTTGSVSIPMMIRAGFAARVAAGVEAIASTGGQLMPPIMGASAFLMAELLELPYRDIVVAAVYPSVLFYVTLFVAVDLHALHMQPNRSANASGTEAIGWRWRFALPIAFLLYLLFALDWTPERAGVWAGASVWLVYLVEPGAKLVQRLRDGVRELLEAMNSVADIVMLAAAAGLVIGVLNLTGISFAITMQIFQLSGGSLALLLLLTAVLSLILGMGLPTVGVYVLLATLVAPALVKLGVSPLAAHFYVMFFGMLSMVTPPVALASFAAASIARVSPWSVSLTTLRMGSGLYLIPVVFVLDPALLSWEQIHGESAWLGLLAALGGVWAWTDEGAGWLRRAFAHGLIGLSLWGVSMHTAPSSQAMVVVVSTALALYLWRSKR